VNPIEGDAAQDDAFVSKLTPAGSGLAYSTYLGGDAGDIGNGIAVDSTGAAYVTGQTDSNDFCSNTVNPIEGDAAQDDAFVSKLTPAGSGLAYSTYLGGDEADRGFGIAVDSSGAAYVTGQTDSTDFDTVNPIEGDSALDDAFVSKLTPAGSALAYSTYLGGDASDIGTAIAVDSAGAAYVTGQTISTDFDTVDPIEGDSMLADVFVSKLIPAGSALAYSSYLGGDGIDSGFGIAVDSTGAAYVTGSTDSSDFDTVGPIERDSAGLDAFVFKVGAQPPPAGLSPTAPVLAGPVPTAAGTCAGKPATILGTKKKDVLTGTGRADVITGLGGADRIRGLGKGDRICGGKGKDRLNGGKGNDLLNGGKGKDRLNGGPGKRDRCAGGPGKNDKATASCEREVGVP
jgi:Ca2+-binding RTX toxin-like protein